MSNRSIEEASRPNKHIYPICYGHVGCV